MRWLQRGLRRGQRRHALFLLEVGGGRKARKGGEVELFKNDPL